MVDQSQGGNRRVGVLVVTLAALLCGAFVGTKTMQKHAIDGSSKPSLLVAESQTDSNLQGSKFSFTVQGEYDTDPGKHYSFVRSGRVVEPFRDTVLTLTPSSDSIHVSSCSWFVTDVNGVGGTAYPEKIPTKHLGQETHDDLNSCSLKAEFPWPGDYKVEVEITTKQGKVLTVTEEVQCYYVRREIHGLSDKDWSRYLDTYLVLMNTPTAEGQKLYGPFYRSLTFLVSLHLNSAAVHNYDHLHEGTGLLTQHIALSNEFERAMQAVTPSFSIPFWDYTVDEIYIRELAEENEARPKEFNLILKETLFSDSYFGSIGGDAAGGMHAIADGRFAYQTVAVNESSEVHSVYGYLRAPWNFNPSPYVTRYHQVCGVRAKGDWPSCASHYKVVYEMDSWYEMAWDAGGSPHGPVHVWLGGIGGGCETWQKDEYPFTAISMEQMHKIKADIFIILKEAWRQGYVEFPKSCSLDDLTEDEIRTMMSGEPRDFVTDCRPICLEKETSVAKAASVLLEGLVGITGLTTTELEDLYQKVLCSETFWPGDHLESASAVEASFWPIHPTLDRLVQFRLLVNPFHAGKGVWWNPFGTTTYCRDSTQCEGHHAGDITPFRTIYRDDGGYYQAGYRTNAEIRDAIVPTSKETYAAHYIYENFDWTHCEEQGYKFSF